MNFIGIDLHTNRFTCCYRNEMSSVDNPQDKRIETYELTSYGMAQFVKTLTEDTCVLIEATITTFSFARLFKDRVKEVVIANTYELKQISLSRCKTDKIDSCLAVPDHQDAGDDGGTAGIAGNDTAKGDTGFAGAFLDLPTVSEAERPT
jgi:hypothetical protein